VPIPRLQQEAAAEGFSPSSKLLSAEVRQSGARSRDPMCRNLTCGLQGVLTRGAKPRPSWELSVTPARPCKVRLV
jgi:hypothetical protein